MATGNCKITSKDEIDLLSEHQKMQKMSQNLQSLQDKKKQRQKNMGKWAEENGELRIVIENSHAKMEENGQQVQAESLVEAELDPVIRGLQAGDERRGCSASQSKMCVAWIRLSCKVS